jgi:DNA-binding CsgD family transcriptional regulator
MASVDPSRLNDADQRVVRAFQLLMDTAPVAALALNARGYYFYINQAAEALLGYDLNQITRCHITELVEADPEWLRRGLDRLWTQGFWSGYAQYRLMGGGVVNVGINAFTHSIRPGGSVHVSLLHQATQNRNEIPLAPTSDLPYTFTAAEMRLLQLMCEGFPDKQMAEFLGVSVWTVNKRVAGILKKMNAASRTEACVRAIRARVLL